MNRLAKKIFVPILVMLFVLISLFFYIFGSVLAAEKNFKYDYGVFLSCGPENLRNMSRYKTIVIDVQNDFTKNDIKRLKKQGHTVYSYINIGSVEKYRDYYDDYKDITLGVYENWPDEKWVDVSEKKWQDFIVDDLSVKIMQTGVDGFFVDNTDVYYNYHTDSIYDGLTNILLSLKRKGKVIINGGDTYVSEYLEYNKNLKEILDGVNQESVFSSILNYDNNTFGENDKDTELYYKKYLSKIKKNKKKVFVLEYTTNKKLKKKIKKYCKKRGYKFYISEDVDLS